LQNRRIVGRALDTPIGGEILTVAVAIVLAVRLIVSLDVAHDVGEREAVMRGGVVDRGPGTPRAPVEQIARARDARRHVAALARIAAPEPADAVAEAVVPLGKAGRMMAELIAARPDVPRLGDQLDARQDRILPQRIEEAGARIEAVRLASER